MHFGQASFVSTSFLHPAHLFVILYSTIDGALKADRYV
jgi:hypothetical protein